MSESETIEVPKQRRNKIAEEKAALRAQLEAFVNKVPAKVNAGGIQTTRTWVDENKRIARAVAGGRCSRHKLREQLASAQQWHAKTEPA